MSTLICLAMMCSLLGGFIAVVSWQERVRAERLAVAVQAERMAELSRRVVAHAQGSTQAFAAFGASAEEAARNMAAFGRAMTEAMKPIAAAVNEIFRQVRSTMENVAHENGFEDVEEMLDAVKPGWRDRG